MALKGLTLIKGNCIHDHGKIKRQLIAFKSKNILLANVVIHVIPFFFPFFRFKLT